MTSSDSRTKEIRRRPSEVNGLILAAVERLVAKEGFAATSMVDIAEAAGVSRSVLYRHYPSKSEIFRASLAQPFLEFIEEWTSLWQHRPVGVTPLHEGMREFIGSLHASLQRHRAAVELLMLADDQLDPSIRAEVMREVREAMEGLMTIVTRELEHRGLPDESAELTVRAIFSMVAGLVLIDASMLPGASTSDEELIDHVVHLVAHGLQLEPPSE